MSEFFRMPAQWHDEIDRALPQALPVDLLGGTKMERINKRVARALLDGPVHKWRFSVKEGIKYRELDTALVNYPGVLWDDMGYIGTMEQEAPMGIDISRCEKCAFFSPAIVRGRKYAEWCNHYSKEPQKVQAKCKLSKAFKGKK